MRTLFALLVVLALPTHAQAQSEVRPEILVLGTYHMANPGRDVHNMHADDVLAPKRQQEIAQLMDVLTRFHPTKIAVEAPVDSKQVGQRYADYLAGTYTLSTNEVDQIGFRLAKLLGHRAVYAVDESGDYPFERVINWAKGNGRGQQLEAMEAGTGARVKAEGDFLASHTVLEMLEYMNADSRVAQDVAMYFAFVPYGDPGDYAGSDLVALWYQRNIRIYHNITALIDSPSDRILVIYGAGHLGWLQQDIANDSRVRLRKLGELTGSPR